ncbi:ABC transporter ATP-binding protein [Rhodococcoides fascians A21d2]|uniref:ABC transporter ATP-binding protein n=1 Tax=Nocardiaceae TaxID=85025 RepID=UPI0005675454|nr:MULTISPECIES: ABC transporter ATP-binding protein [Rhodococcus]OZC44407.1 ABC transporter ATP-binding protein [Rhodococcus sp. WWJCD1]QII01447.1 ABC transporter ATP-binding protein [Rhodococcus fascians A21d2]
MFLSLENVSSSYEEGGREVPVLSGVDVDIPAGSFVSVMGPSGSGKSTLLLCAAGLRSPTTGRVVLDGTDVTALRGDHLTRFRRRAMGFVFQSFDLLPALTIRENVELPLRLDGGRPDAVRSTRLLEMVGLTEVAGGWGKSAAGRVDVRPDQLSGGQKQRVAIARALVNDPRIVFADEPTGALDLSSAAVVLRILRGIADSGRTIVMVTHDPVAAAASDSVLFLADGRIVDRLDAPTAAAAAARLTDLVSRV